MAETVQKQNLDLDNSETFETGKDRFAFFDHFSKIVSFVSNCILLQDTNLSD